MPNPTVFVPHIVCPDCGDGGGREQQMLVRDVRVIIPPWRLAAGPGNVEYVEGYDAAGHFLTWMRPLAMKVAASQN